MAIDKNAGVQYASAVVNATAGEVTTVPAYLHTATLNNQTAAAAFFSFYDALAADVTVGAGAMFIVDVSPSADHIHMVFDPPIPFYTAITVSSATARDGSTNAACDFVLTYTTE